MSKKLEMTRKCYHSNCNVPSTTVIMISHPDKRVQTQLQISIDNGQTVERTNSLDKRKVEEKGVCKDHGDSKRRVEEKFATTNGTVQNADSPIASSNRLPGMKALPIVILVAVLCGPCACQNAKDNALAPGYHGLITLLDNTAKSIIHNVPLLEIFEKYVTLAKNVIDFLEQYASRVSEGPRKIIETFVRLARDFIANVQRVLESGASYYKSSINGLVTSAQNGARNLLSALGGNGSNASRKLRSILSSPIEELRQVTSSIVSEFGSQLLSITLELLKWMWQFMRTTGFPWMHNTLDKIAAMNGTPIMVRTAIQDLDVAYGLLQLFGVLN